MRLPLTDLPSVLPPWLLAADRWVAWRPLDGSKKPVDDRGYPFTGWNEPENLMSFAGAVARGSRFADGAVGFVLPGSGYGGADLDHCLSNEGKLEPLAEAIVEKAAEAGAYIEISPSGDGIKIFGLTNLPTEEVNFDGGQPRVTGARSPFFTVTGNCPRDEWRGAPVARDIGEVIQYTLFVMSAEVAAAVGGKKRAKQKGDKQRPENWTVPPGAQNSHMTSEAGALRRRGAGEEEIAAFLWAQVEAGRYPPEHRKAPWTKEDVRKIAKSVCSYDPEPGESGGKGGRSHATKLVNLAKGLPLFCSEDGAEAFAIVPSGETLPLRETKFRDWLSGKFYETFTASPSSGALHDACGVLAGMAQASGKRFPVRVRVAATRERVVLDLGRDDQQVLVIDAEGWRVGPAPDDVRMLRRPGMLPLPNPVKGGRPLPELLKLVTNVGDGQPMKMLTAYLVAALRGLEPFPILVGKGQQGAAKSTGSKAARDIIDPSTASLSFTPKEPRDLAITAGNSYMLAFDNLSKVDDWLSDALSGLSTGAGFRTRAMTTNKEETIFSAARPVILNGIPDLVRRGDLADRALVIEFEPITEKDRLTSAEVRERFAGARAEILGHLADAVSQAIKAPVRPKLLPRMADFACVIESAAPALGWAPGEFLKAYGEERREAMETLLDGDVLYLALEAVLKAGDFLGTTAELLALVQQHTPEQNEKLLPRSGKGLVNSLARLAPALRMKEILWKPPQRGGARDDRTRRCRLERRSLFNAEGGEA
jgi:hypothetical protein